MKLRIEKNILPFLESGLRVSGCHTQALLSSSIDLKTKLPPFLMEACTTVPFGISHVESDPNRLLDCVTDPDIGLNIACNALGIKYQYKYFKTGDQSARAISEMCELLKNGPAVLGPVNMGNLPYLRNGQQFIGIDHYIVVESFDPDTSDVTIIDPERVGSVRVNINDLIPAWAAIGLREGKGSYTIRQIIEVPDKIDWRTCLSVLAPELHKNIDRMQRELIDNFGRFSKTTLIKNQHRSLWVGLEFCLKTRIRRILCCCGFILQFLNRDDAIMSQLLGLAEDAILICQKLIKKLSIENIIIPSQVYELVNTEIEFGIILRKVI